MAVPAEQMKEFEAIESAEISENGDVIRSHMNQILSDPYFQKILDRESLQGYQDIANKKGHIAPDDTENLKRFYKFMEKQWKELHQMKKRITGHTEQAVREKVITEEDRAFYKDKMRENVINGKQIVTKEVLEKAEKDILESLEKRRDERNQYDKIANHKIVKDSGVLKVSANESLKVPDEKGFLKLSVPDRRVLLKKLKEALPKAEKYAEIEGGIEAEEMTIDYRKLLIEAEKDGLIGERTMEKYMNGFKKVDNQEKKYWLEEMKNGNQLGRYEELWKNIRKVLQGTSLKRMEKMRDSMGYSELLHEFGRMQEMESNMVTKDYSEKLGGMHQQGVISLHTMNAFIDDIESQTLEGKKEYLKKIDQQMQRYKILRTKINQIKDKGARESLNEMYTVSEYGYREIEAKYNRFVGQKISQSDELCINHEAEAILNNMESDVVRKEFRRSIQELDYGQHKKFKEKLTDFFSKRSEKNTGNYQDSIRSARNEKREADLGREESNKRPVTNPILHPLSEESENTDEEMNEDISFSNQINSLEMIEEELEEGGINRSRVSIREVKTKSSNDGEFRRMSYADKTGRVKRIIRATGSKESVQAFNQETLLNPDDVDVHIFGTDGSVAKEAGVLDIKKGIKALEKTLEEKRIQG